MKRAAVFAHYDKDSVIDDYVIYYLNGLKEVAQTIVFVSCCDLPVEEISKLNGIVSYVIAEKHDEYDFGSYKRGFLYLKDRLNEFDELIFANDSCYGPLYPLNKVFSKMEKEVCDFWGITKNNYGYKKKLCHFFAKRPHIQSYFIVFRKDVFTSDLFVDFMKSVEHQNIKKQIVSKYEIGLTELFVKHGFKFKTYINAYENINNIVVLKWRQIIEKYQMPFVKKSLFDLKNTNVTTIEEYERILNNYPVSLIILPREINRKVSYNIKKVIFDTIVEFPFPIRKVFEIFINLFCPFFKD